MEHEDEKVIMTIRVVKRDDGIESNLCFNKETDVEELISLLEGIIDEIKDKLIRKKLLNQENKNQDRSHIN